MVMCNNYEENQNTYIINYEDMFNIIIQNLHKGFIVEVSFYFLYTLMLHLILKIIYSLILVKRNLMTNIPIELPHICYACKHYLYPVPNIGKNHYLKFFKLSMIKKLT